LLKGYSQGRGYREGKNCTGPSAKTTPPEARGHNFERRGSKGEEKPWFEPSYSFLDVKSGV